VGRGEESVMQAKAKGVKRQGDIWQVLARAENGLGNKAASTAALKEAAKYPETQKWAGSCTASRFGAVSPWNSWYGLNLGISLYVPAAGMRRVAAPLAPRNETEPRPA
jgi:hypothetical protein